MKEKTTKSFKIGALFFVIGLTVGICGLVFNMNFLGIIGNLVIVIGIIFLIKPIIIALFKKITKWLNL